ncbi:hypothetical protein BOTBODRAFT_155761 [Botryobasidium botryosum FD-172 SS1]|uniref:Peptidase S8/S53 domain-containing protein n=1 Tax=Botryobasidium botryosum (strain FD-172 SS1) TaxID=930990 RepID=A0A067MQ44_BOTB1|nr:hypothetical protein BOTBODRAFT_155761 [Botryobasidium botryosum FD-172 SS1]
MRPLSTSLCALALVIPVFAVPTLVPVQKVAGPIKADSYIIKLKQGADKSGHLSKLAQILATADSHVKYDYEAVFRGYAGTIKGAALEFIRASKDVEYIYPDHCLHSFNMSNLVDLTYLLITDIHGGSDTGIYIAHNSFGGRARWGATFGGYANADGNGHGTHTAGTIGGASYGLATSANLIAVKVLSDAGSGSTSDIISGINWVASSAKSSGRPSIANLALGGSASQPLDDAVNNAIKQGVHVTTTVGNSNVDASNTSPARVRDANTVGAVGPNNVKSSSSNYGPVLDVWAPGQSILSAWIGSPTATNTLSGGSMATAYVAGVLAVAIGSHGNASPLDLSADLKSHARPVVTGVPAGTTNLLATPW